MDVSDQVKTIQEEQLPQIRRITTLGEIKHVEPSKVLPPPLKKKPRPPKFSVKVFLVGLVFLYILGMGLALFTIYRYNKINKRLYQISTYLKGRLTETHRELKNLDKVKNHMAKNRSSLLQAYRNYSKLQFRENSFKALLAAKTSWVGSVLGNLRVARAQVEALKAQRDLLATQAKEKDERIRELTTQLLNNIGEQEILVNQNIKLRQERDRLTRELAEE